jgi:hypothetical protein
MDKRNDHKIEVRMTSKGFGGDAQAILSHPNIARDLKKAQNSKLVRTLQKKKG